MPNLEQLWFKYGKSVTAAVGFVVMTVQAAASDHVITRLEWVQIAAALVTAVGVYLLPDHPTWSGVKVVAAGLTALLGAVATVMQQGLTSGSWPDILIAACTVLFVSLSPSRSVGAPAPKAGG